MKVILGMAGRKAYSGGEAGWKAGDAAVWPGRVQGFVEAFLVTLINTMIFIET